MVRLVGGIGDVTVGWAAVAPTVERSFRKGEGGGSSPSRRATTFRDVCGAESAVGTCQSNAFTCRGRHQYVTWPKPGGPTA